MNHTMKRSLAIVLTLVMVLALAPAAFAAGQTAKLGDALAGAYAGVLTDAEAAAVKALGAGTAISYAAPAANNADGHVTVDASTSNVKIAAESFTDASGNEWSPVSAAVVRANGDKSDLALENGKTAFENTAADAFTVQVTYACAAKVDGDLAYETLVLPAKLAEGVALLKELEEDIIPPAKLVQGKLPVLYNLVNKEVGVTVTLKGGSTLNMYFAKKDHREFVNAVEQLKAMTGAVLDEKGKACVDTERDLALISMMEPGASLSLLLDKGADIKAENEELLGLLETILGTDAWRTLVDLSADASLSEENAELVAMLDDIPEIKAKMEGIAAADWSASSGSELYTNEQILGAAAQIEAIDASAIPADRVIPAVGDTLVIAEQTVTTAAVTAPVKGAVAAGWRLNSVGWWYCNDDGTYPADAWQEIKGVWYHFDADGYMQTGWQAIGGKWYYFNDAGAMLTGWQAINGKWYFFHPGGSMATGWVLDGSKWYYTGADGAMLTGWQAINGKWYFFNPGGSMAIGWILDGGKWYYTGADGVMLTGWQQINGLWYFFREGGSMAASEWISGYWIGASGAWTYQPRGSWKHDAGGWWYGDTSGWYARSETLKIDGVSYTFNAAGYLA